MATDNNLHKNHRSRVQKRVSEHGFAGMADHEVLEYLLFFVLPRIDTNPIAHNLLNHFGSFSQMLEAEESELAAVPGIGPAAARFLHALLLTDRYYRLDRRKPKRALKTPEDLTEYAKPLFCGEKRELVYAVILDDCYHLLRCVQLEAGLPNSVELPAAKLVREVMLCNGTAVVLAHNHPAGLAVPSQEDVHATGRMVKILGNLEITLLDHVVVAGEDAVTMRQRGLMPVYDPLRGEVEYPAASAAL